MRVGNSPINSAQRGIQAKLGEPFPREEFVGETPFGPYINAISIFNSGFSYGNPLENETYLSTVAGPAVSTQWDIQRLEIEFALKAFLLSPGKEPIDHHYILSIEVFVGGIRAGEIVKEYILRASGEAKGVEIGLTVSRSTLALENFNNISVTKSQDVTLKFHLERKDTSEPGGWFVFIDPKLLMIVQQSYPVR